MSKDIEIVKHSVIPRREEGREPAPVAAPDAPGSLFSFRYSYTEVSAQGGNIHVKRRDTRFTEGRLISEESEGMLDRAAYDDMVREAQSFFLNQMLGFMRMFLPQTFLPSSGRRKRDE